MRRRASQVSLWSAECELECEREERCRTASYCSAAADHCFSFAICLTMNWQILHCFTLWKHTSQRSGGLGEERRSSAWFVCSAPPCAAPELLRADLALGWLQHGRSECYTQQEGRGAHRDPAHQPVKTGLCLAKAQAAPMHASLQEVKPTGPAY